MEVAAQNFAPTIPPPPSLPFVPWGKWAARIFHAVPPHVFREKFPETKVIGVDLELLGRLSFFHILLLDSPEKLIGPLDKFRSRTNLFLRRVNTRTFVSWILLFFVHVFFVRVRRSRFLINDIIALAILERKRNFIFSSLAMIWKFNSVLGSTGCIIFEHSDGKITFRKVPI